MRNKRTYTLVVEHTWFDSEDDFTEGGFPLTIVKGFYDETKRRIPKRDLEKLLDRFTNLNFDEDVVVDRQSPPNPLKGLTLDCLLILVVMLCMKYNSPAFAKSFLTPRNRPIWNELVRGFPMKTRRTLLAGIHSYYVADNLYAALEPLIAKTDAGKHSLKVILGLTVKGDEQADWSWLLNSCGKRIRGSTRMRVERAVSQLLPPDEG